MSTALELAFLAMPVLVLAPACVLLVQVVCAIAPPRRAPSTAGRRPRVAVLVPAHDEAAGITATLSTLAPQLERDDRLVVVADNCSDDTARVAAAAGAETVERNDPARRGKGYALDAGIRYLEHDPPETVVIVDADCTVAPGAIGRIARTSAATGRPVQALYLMEAPGPGNTLTSIAQFAWIVKNLVRPLGFHRLSLPCQLMGSGMAIPWPALRSARLASGHIVEDLKLGLDLARAGTPPLFCPEALVSSRFPASAEGTRSQRTRWEHGHLATITAEAPRLILEGLLGRGSGVLALAADLCVPPLALLTLAVAASCALGAVSYAVLGDWLAPGIALLGAACLLAAVLIAWARFGRQTLPLRRLASVPWYVAAKVPLYLRFVVQRQVEWVRSRRDQS